MKQTRSKTKVLLTLLVTLLVIGALAVVSFAADKNASYDNKYGQIVPTNSKLEARKTSFSFYGDKATLYFMRISEGKENANYAVEIYADKNYTQLIRSLSDEYNSQKGNTPLAITWKFKSTPSGTYYGKCYTYVSRDDGNVIDTDSVETFKIKIDRLSKSTVKLNKISNTSKGVKLTWTPLTTATKYKVYRKASGDKKWTAIKTLGEAAYTYTDTTAKSGKKYSYTVKCYEGKYVSLYDKKGLSITYLAQPKLVDVIGNGSSGYAKVQWKAVSGAGGYEIYRKGGSLSSSEWKKIATVKGGKKVSYIDKTATKSDWYYSYSVRAYSGSSKSTYNNEGIDFDYIKAPTLKKASSYTNGVKIEWSNSNDEVVKYYVYRKTSSGWKKIGTTTNKSFVDKSASSGKTYTYTVKGVSENNAGAYNSKGIKVKYLAAPKLGTVTFDSKDRAKVTWSKVSGATGYIVYRKIDSATSWTKIAEVKGASKVSYLDTVKKTSGSTYKYTVKAVSGSVKSYHSTSGIKNMYLSQPVATLANKVTEGNAVGVNVTWKTIKGAKGYHVYRRDDVNTSWKRIAANVTELSYYDTTAVSGATYEYTVKAVNGSAESRYSAVEIVALERPIITDAVLTSDGVSLTWNTVKGADTYYVYRKTVGGKWTVIGSYSLNSFIDTSEEAKTSPFCYTVAAEADGYKSDYDNAGAKNFAEVSELTAEFTPATETETAFITVNWVYDGVAESIELFKSIGDDKVSLGVFDAVSGITQYTDKDIEIGTEYTYTVKAVKEGKVSTEKSASAKYPHAPIVAVEFDAVPFYSEEEFYITVNWTPVEFAENYEIYKRLTADDPWVKVATVSANDITEETATYKDVDVDTEISYCYTVKGVASDRDSLYNEEGVKATILTPIAPAAGIIAKENVVKETAEDGTVTEKTVAVISWDEVANAQYYRVYRKTADTDWEYMGLALAGETSYADDTIVQGVKYTYTIKTSASGRGEAMNETGIDFCWELPEEEVPETPEEEIPETPETEIPENPEDGTSENPEIAA